MAMQEDDADAERRIDAEENAMAMWAVQVMTDFSRAYSIDVSDTDVAVTELANDVEIVTKTIPLRKMLGGLLGYIKSQRDMEIAKAQARAQAMHEAQGATKQ